MNRLNGLMPESEIKITKRFIDDIGFRITITSGENGWTIIYHDKTTKSADIVDTSENNLQAALNYLKSQYNVTEL